MSSVSDQGSCPHASLILRQKSRKQGKWHEQAVDVSHNKLVLYVSISLYLNQSTSTSVSSISSFLMDIFTFAVLMTRHSRQIFLQPSWVHVVTGLLTSPWHAQPDATPRQKLVLQRCKTMLPGSATKWPSRPTLGLAKAFPLVLIETVQQCSTFKVLLSFLSYTFGIDSGSSWA